MKTRWTSAIFAALLASPAFADPTTVTGVDGNGSGGVYQIGGENYWWFCIEPSVPTNLLPNQSVSMNIMGVLDGWDQQNTERLDYYTTNNEYYDFAIPRQVAVMEYVMDTYLPWGLAGPSGRFAEQDGDASNNYEVDDLFYNRFFAVQNFLAETYGKQTKDDFTDMTDYVDYYESATSDFGMARSGIFQSILADVENLATINPTFFDTYTAQRQYVIGNTLFASGDENNYQDVIIIVPEPGSALLIASCGFAFMLRRRRRAR